MAHGFNLAYGLPDRLAIEQVPGHWLDSVREGRISARKADDVVASSSRAADTA